MKKTPFPLIECPVGAVTYEHTLAEHLFGDIYIGDSERNLYVDKYHEINLCAHYNARIPETLSFDSKYHFYVTDGRMCIPLHHNWGIPIEDIIIEKYNSLDEAKESEYNNHFCDLKANIDKWIGERKQLGRCTAGGISGGAWRNCNGILCIYCEKYIEKTDEFVQLFTKDNADILEMTKSHDKIGHLSGYIQNFEDINEKELHLFEHLNLAEIVREHNSPYFDFYEMVREMVKFSYDAATGKITGGKAFFE